MKIPFILAMCAVLMVPVAWGQSSGLLLEEMTSKEVGEALASGVDTVIVTIGATEQHGPQIALAADSVTGDYLGPEIARRIGRALVAPNIRIGVSSDNLYFPGTLSARTEVLVPLLREYVHSLEWHGFRHVALIPTHAGNMESVERAATELSKFYPHLNVMAFSDTTSYNAALTSTAAQLGIDPAVAGSHAGASETSMVLATRPDLVRMDKAEAGYMGDAQAVSEEIARVGTQSVAPNGVLGDPRPATAEAGQAYLDALATLLADFVTEGREQWKVSPPTDVPYVGLPAPSGPYVDGIRTRRMGDYEGARAYFSARLKESPEDVSARVELARTAVLQEQYEEARQILEPLLQHPSAETREWAYLEDALVAPYQGLFKEAMASLEISREIAAERGNTWGAALRLLNVGYFLNELGDLDGAEAAYEAALLVEHEVSGLHLELHHLIAMNELKQGRFNQAGERLRLIADATLQEQFAGDIRRFYHINGEILLARGQTQDALVNLKLAVQYYDSPYYRESLARAYIASQQYEEAEKEFVHLINITDERLDIPIHYVKARYQLGKLYQLMGRDADAIAMYEQFLGIWQETDMPVLEIEAAEEALASLRNL